MSLIRSIFRPLSRWLSRRHVYIIRSLALRSKDQLIAPNFDYVRHATLGLLAEEILSKNIAGAVAELGVYQGDFAQHINRVFSDRKLYLFDTFEGFDTADLQKDQHLKYSKGDQNFSNTSVDTVLNKMPFPKNCIIQKGHFPSSASAIDVPFCFVSIDADLYEPIMAGLEFFYPKLSSGGYIMIHDFNNDEYKGVRQAVKTFCTKHLISYTPIPDGCGSVIVTK